MASVWSVIDKAAVGEAQLSGKCAARVLRCINQDILTAILPRKVRGFEKERQYAALW